jgi:hypothetical protein
METRQFESSPIIQKEIPINQVGKKVYFIPCLTEWGSLKDLTKGSGGIDTDFDFSPTNSYTFL